MRINRSQSMLWVLLAGVVAAAGCQGDSQTRARGPVGVASHAATIDSDFDSTLALAEGQLQFLEETVNQVLSTRQLSSSQAEMIDSVMFDYGANMKKGFDLAANDAQLASSSEGTSGSGETIGIYERFAQGHVPRVQSFATQMDEIDRGVSDGTITSSDTTGMKLKSPGPKPVKFAAAAPAPGAVSRFLTSLGRSAGNLIISRAEASVAIPCVSLCLAKNWTACATCIAGAVPKAIQAWNEFLSCWNSCSKCNWSHLGCCAKRAWCLVKLIGVLA